MADPRGTTEGPGTLVTALIKGVSVEAALSESVPNFYPEAGGNVADDAWRGARRCRCFPAIAGFGVASGRLPDHADPDVLPWGEPGGSDVFDHGAARETVRASARD